MTTPFKFNLKKGHTIVGKWKRGQYHIEQLLGEGANGRVYLVSNDWQWYAMKLGASSIDLQSEINALKALQTVTTSSLASPYLKDIDDWITPEGKEIPFYTMRYVKGQNMAQYLAEYGADWFPLLILNLLRCIARLHQAGWIFGDLKLENVIVESYGQVELIDFGGASQIGKSVKQFTEIYDRGFWNHGSRSADAAYDLFSIGVLCIQLFEPKKLAQLSKDIQPQKRSVDQLLLLAREVPPLSPYLSWLEQVFEGKLKHGEEAAEAWRVLAHQRKKNIKSNKTPSWLKVMITISIISLCLTASLYALDYTGLLR